MDSGGGVIQISKSGIVIASEAKQSIAQHKERMDCFVASLLAMTLVERPTHSCHPPRMRIGVKMFLDVGIDL
jgi:hypothetical protein